MDKPLWAQGKSEDACEQLHEIQQNSGEKNGIMLKYAKYSNNYSVE